MLKRTLGIAAAAGALAIFGAGAAAAAPTPVADERPCRTSEPCPWSPSEDKLTWCYKGYCGNYDKLGNFVCTTPTDIWCTPAMAVIRALPPVAVGEWLHPGS